MTQVEVKNPYDGSIIDTVEYMDEAGVHAAIDRAQRVAPELATMPAYQRGAILERTASLMDAHHESLAQLMAKENGKPIQGARGEVSRGMATLRFSAEEARRIHGETIPMDAQANGVGIIGYYVREPIGIIAAITPFNFPINLAIHKIGPAIAAGCPIVLKPSPFTPLVSLRLAELFIEAGLPEGAFEVVVGDAEVGTALTTDPRIAMITFTGSVGVAKKISEVAGLRRTTFELGGNGATVVDANADIDKAVNSCVAGGFGYSGQVCNSVQRIYIHKDRYEEFKTKYKSQVETLKVGDPLDDNTDMGPLINDAAAERITAWINNAVEQGAKVVTGNQSEGRMFHPTVLEDVREDMPIMCEEVFGPVVNLVPFDDFDTALDAVNASEYGLQAGVFTNDLGKAMRATQKLDVGGVMINNVSQWRVDHMPYGGNKNSGTGREGPRFAVEEMTKLKMVVINPGS